MRGLRGHLRAGVGSLALIGVLASPTAAQAQPNDDTSEPGSTAEWATDVSGCSPIRTENALSAHTEPGLDADTVFVLNDGVTHPAALDPGTGQPVNPSGPAEGVLSLTLEVRTDQRDSEPWPGLDRLGFDISAMDAPDPAPFEIDVGVSGMRDVNSTAIEQGDAERAGMVTLLESDAVSADDWERAFGAYAVVAAELVLTTPDGQSWCEVELTGSTDDPIEAFEVVPSGSAIDAATEEKHQNAAELPSYAPLATVATLTVLLAGVVFVRARALRRERAALNPPEESR